MPRLSLGVRAHPQMRTLAPRMDLRPRQQRNRMRMPRLPARWLTCSPWWCSRVQAAPAFPDAPSKPFPVPLEERRAKRKAAREARHAVGVSALSGAAPLTVVGLKPSSAIAAPPRPSPRQLKVQEDRQWLEGMLAVDASPAGRASATSSAALSPKRVLSSAAPSPSAALGPSLLATTRSALTAGPSLLPAAAGVSPGVVVSRRASTRAAAAAAELAASPSAPARSANAARARAPGSGRRVTASTAASAGATMAAELAQKAQSSSPSGDGTSQFMKVGLHGACRASWRRCGTLAMRHHAL